MDIQLLIRLMKKHLAIVLLFGHLSVTVYGHLSSRIYVEVPSCFDPSTTTGVGTTSSIHGSNVQCGVECSLHPLCTSFSRKTEIDQTTCYLNHVAVTEEQCVNDYTHFSLLDGNYSQCNGHGDFNTSTSRCRCRHGYIGDACDELAEDCSEAFSVGQYRDEIGVFYVQPSPLIHPFTALCSMKWLGRTYVMFNANYFPFVDFNRNWYDYKHGFGDLRQASTAQNGNFWIGNELLHYVTNNRRHTLIVDARFPEGMYLQYQYYGFVVKSEEEGYAFTFEFGGPQPEYALGDGLTLANGTKFSTYDVDNDLSGDNCADIHQSGWWFTTCGGYNPTGKPQPSSDSYMSFDPLALSWPIPGNNSPDALEMFLTYGLTEDLGSE